MAKLMKRNEDLEAEVVQLKELLKAKTREATESTQVGHHGSPGVTPVGAGVFGAICGKSWQNQ